MDDCRHCANYDFELKECEYSRINYWKYAACKTGKWSSFRTAVGTDKEVYLDDHSQGHREDDR